MTTLDFHVPEMKPPPPPPVPTSSESRPPAPARRVRRSRRRLVLVAVGLALLCFVAGYALYTRAVSDGAAKPTPTPPSVPVLAAVVTRRDLPIYLIGLGTVTASSTVTVHTRVDGQLDNVFFTEGQFVRESDSIAQIDPRPYQVQLSQAEGQLARDQALLKNAEIELRRAKEAIEAIPRQQLDTAQATVDQYRGIVRSDQAAIDNAKLQLTYCRITSPVTGRIGLSLIDPGNIVHAADVGGLAVITQVRPIDVIFTLPQDEIPRVLKRMGGKPALTVDVFDRELKSKLATGSLAAIDSQIDPASGTIRFKATFANDDDALFPNQFVNARLLVDTVPGALVVPTAAVQRGPQSTFVYVVKADGAIELRDVQVGPEEGGGTSITTGVTPGETVVTDGVDKLQPGTKVVVQHELTSSTSLPTTSSTTRPAKASP